METLWVPFRELYDAVVAGRVRDMPVLVAVLMAAAHGAVPGFPLGGAGAE